MKKILLIMIGIVLLIGFISADTGCCFDVDTGLCSSNAEQTACENLNGEFTQTDNCNSVSRCTKGCCILGGDNVEYITSRACQIMSRNQNVEFNWQGGVSEESCLEIAGQQEMGACTYGGEYEKNCDFTTRSSCNGEFHSGLLCTAKTLNTVCLASDDTTCVEAKDQVYFLDSCGNRANIYDAENRNNEDYWTYIRTPEESCYYGEINAESQICGNCNYKLGSTCSATSSKNVDYGNYICKDLNCEGGRKNGDHWCEDDTGDMGGATTVPLRYYYHWEGTLIPYSISEWRTTPITLGTMGTVFGEDIGNKYPVGSRFIRKYCLNGEIHTEPCGTFRSEYCEAGECVLNDYQSCYTATTEDECDGLYDCQWIENKIGGYQAGHRVDDDDKGLWYTGKLSYLNLLKSLMDDLDPDFGFDRASANRPTNISYCAPKVTPGTSFWTSSGDSVCSQGDYTHSAIEFWKPHPDATAGDVHKQNRCIARCNELALGTQNYHILPVIDPEFEEALKRRCRSLGDCGGKLNIEYIGTSRKDNNATMGFSRNDDNHNYYTITFNCDPYRAPKDGNDCELCGEDGIPCSEYRCKSLGMRCEYSEPAGADRGYCKPSSDVSPPKITPLTSFISENYSYASITLSGFSINPDIQPNTPIQFGVKTDEEATCKFDIGVSGNSFEEMENEFGEVWGKEHKVILSLPGQTAAGIANASEHEVITEGDFNIYVRCMDGASNWNIDPFLVTFKVLDTPDTIAPIIYDLNPMSGFRIKHNTTEQIISFKINEPADCRWDLEDKDYDLMNNSLNCENVLTDQGALNGYYNCYGLLTNVTNDTEKQTDYYIRCKDQPWLEGQETDIYKRNKNFKSEKYVLKASNPLEILEISPTGDVIKNALDTSVTLKAVTGRGGYAGKAMCVWKINEGGARIFFQTNSSRHSQILTNRSEGIYNLTVACIDESGNTAFSNSLFTLKIDRFSPSVSRAYYSSGSLKVITDEKAECKFIEDPRIACGFDFDNPNMTRLSGIAEEHTIAWEDDTTYYIKCKDQYGNINPGCGIIVRTY